MIPQHKDDGVTSELRATRTADPTAELREAIKKNDLRFRGVAGYSITVPGIPGGRWNPVVDICGIHVIKGTSDVIRSDEHHRLQPIADKYADRYNRLLFAHLLQINDSSVVKARRYIDKELSRIERSDPLRDAEKATKKASSREVIMLPGSSDSVPGIDQRAMKEVGDKRAYSFPIWSFAFIPEVMTPQQRTRFSRQVSRYIAPYNRYVFAEYQKRIKAWKPTTVTRKH